MSREYQVSVRCAGEHNEIHAGVMPKGKTPHVLCGDDLLLLVDLSEGRLRCRGRDHTLPPALIAVVEEGEAVVVDLPTDCAYRALYLPSGLIPEALNLSSNVIKGNGAGRRIFWIVGAVGLCELINHVDSREGIIQLIHMLARDHRAQVRFAAEEQVSHAVVRRVCDHLRNGYDRKLTLAELSRMAGMGRYALARAFTREIGIPPHAYQMHVRIKRARDLINMGRRLSEVSLEVGFTDQSHLNRHFKRLVGTTPGLYARLAVPPSSASRYRTRRGSKRVPTPPPNDPRTPPINLS